MAKSSEIMAAGASVVVLAYVAGIVGTLAALGPAHPVFGPSDVAPPKAAARLAATPSRPVPAPSAPRTDKTAAPSAIAAVAPPAGTNVAAGAAAFAKCKACHTADPKGGNGVGPRLHGVVGRPIGSVAGYAYSPAMKTSAGETWTPARLDAFLADPKNAVKGNKMAFAGLSSAKDRTDVIAFLAGTSGARVATAAAPATAAPGPSAPAPSTTVVAAATVVAVSYADLPPRSAPEAAAVADAVKSLREAVERLDYQRAQYHPIHFRPAIDKASNEECLVCHAEILREGPRRTAPAGIEAGKSLAWYQTLATYQGEQQGFHARHLTSGFAQATMNLACTFCHRGNDPREESPSALPASARSGAGERPGFTLRKMVDPSDTCLRCHGAMPDPVGIMGLGGPWHEVRADMESEDQPNGCLTCHAETFRTERHRVNYLKAKSIEDLAQLSSDVCWGCHGGRAWYRTAYPYARHAWPGMDPAVPDWAKDRPAESDARHRLAEPTK